MKKKAPSILPDIKKPSRLKKAEDFVGTVVPKKFAQQAYIDRQLRHKLSVYSSQKDRTMSEIIEDAVREYMDNHP